MSTRGFFGWRKNGVIKGVYISSNAYPSYYGKLIVEKLCSTPMGDIKGFITGRVRLVKESCETSFGDLINADWQKPHRRRFLMQDESYFLKNAFSMEYGYVVDLDKAGKVLLVFKGLGARPSKGYEDLVFHIDDQPIYTNFKGSINLDRHGAAGSYVVLRGLCSRNRRLAGALRRLVNLPDAELIAECAQPEKYVEYPERRYDVEEMGRVLDCYLKHRLTTAA